MPLVDWGTEWKSGLPPEARSDRRGPAGRRNMMLVLCRKKDERVLIYQQTREGLQKLGSVMLVGTDGPNKARLGFEFPPDIYISREESDRRDAECCK
jgi:sRNA-binding carbon storage regulator CsrA